MAEMDRGTFISPECMPPARELRFVSAVLKALCRRVSALAFGIRRRRRANCHMAGHLRDAGAWRPNCKSWVPMLPTLLLLAAVQGGSTPPLTAPEILERMIRADNARLAALAGYSGVRHYHFENKQSGKTAEVTVHMSCGPDGVKTFEVVSETGSSFVRSHVIRKMIEAEAESSQRGERKESRIIPENYEFRLVGTETWDGRDSYVLEINPKKPSKFAIRGKIWVDAEDFAIARVEGEPAKNPSFWIRSAKVEQRYGRSGRFWLPALNHSVAQARIFGLTEVVIEYSEYKTSAHESPVASRAAEDLRQ